MADLTYRYHGTIRQAHMDGELISAGLSPSVVIDHRKGLNWRVQYSDAEWDDVTTDT
jgi:hypothetical protein